jgi:regulator of cell morphogenesis and NO signaling
MNFNSETRVKDIALPHPAARRVLEEAQVDYCCGGEKSLPKACLHAGVDSEEILKRLRENSQRVNPTDANWTTAPLSDLTAHVKNNHHGYVREAIPRVTKLLEKVKTTHGKHHPELAEIEISFREVGKEMIMHMQKEEQILFPYIEALDRAANGKGILEPPFFQTVKNPIQAMMKEHDAAGDLVRQIRKASAEYAAPADACTSYKTLLLELHQFELDLHQHVHLENNILFPRAVELEGAVV